MDAVSHSQWMLTLRLRLGKDHPSVDDKRWKTAFSRIRVDGIACSAAQPPTSPTKCLNALSNTESTMQNTEDSLDPYYYSRDHDAGPGSWCVRGPLGFQIKTLNLDKNVAYIIGKVLSGKLKEARDMLQSLEQL